MTARARSALHLSGCTVDLATGYVRPGVVLTARERAVLAHLVANPGRDIDRDELLTEVWGYSNRSFSRTVDTTIRRLREKIELDPARPRHLLTAWGSGYRFEPAATDDPRPQPGPNARPVRWRVLGDRKLDLDTGRVVVDEQTTWLTPQERALLATLAEAEGAFVDPATLARAVWGRCAGNEQALHSALHRIRRKLEPDPAAPRYVVTVRGLGVRLAADGGPCAQAVATVVQLRPGFDPARWAYDPVRAGEELAALAAELDRSSRAAGGVPAADGWCHLFADPRAAVRWAEAHREPRLAIVVQRGLVVSWTDPVGRIQVAGPAAVACAERLARTPPGQVAVEDDEATPPT